MPSLSRTIGLDVGATALRLAALGLDPKGQPFLQAWKAVELEQDFGKGGETFPALLQGMARLAAESGKIGRAHV